MTVLRRGRIAATAVTFAIVGCGLALADDIGPSGGNLGPGGNKVTVAGDMELGFGKKPGPLEISIATENAYWSRGLVKKGVGDLKNVDSISIVNADGRPVDLQGPHGTANEFGPQKSFVAHLQLGGCNFQQPSEEKDAWGGIQTATYCGELPAGNYHLVLQRNPIAPGKANPYPPTNIIVFTNGDGYTPYTGGPAEGPEPAQSPETTESPEPMESSEPAESPEPAQTPEPAETQSP
ncbi:MAG: hypothetical protein JO160_07525 [Candidatus Eremiobacteraeota bacterium]|nr:hypothetical protein [Candidatus Eremiobacteraeota bacterium]